MKTDTKQLIKKIEENAKTHNNQDRFVRVLQVSDIIRQGDIYLERIPETSVPKKGKVTQNMQLAPGTSKGSRHVLESLSPDSVTVYESPKNDPLSGPVIKAKERFNVNHPEHPNFSVPSGCYQVTYQRDFAVEERARRAD